MSYWDIDSLLAEEEMLKVVFKAPAKGIGFIDTLNKRQDIEVDDVVQIPAWLAFNLLKLADTKGSRLIAKIEMVIPHMLSRKYLDFLLSMQSNSLVNLREQCQYYHDVGAILSYKLEMQQAPLLKTLQQSRAREILNRIFAIKFAQSNTVALHCLTEDERGLYLTGYHKSTEVSRWRGRQRISQLDQVRKRVKR